ncbi:MAG: BACON domain-containing protein [Bacteroidales bacterium]|nr:BACON domain-containing protein [Bacteroidales bacterium]
MKKTIFKIIALLVILAGGVVSCKDKPDNILTVDETPIAIASEGGKYSITVESNENWFAVVENAENADWCTLDNSTGTGNGAITINIVKNPFFATRSATAKITSGGVTRFVIINQEAAENPLPELDCEDELYYYYDDEKKFYVDQLSLDEPFLKDWLLVGFVSRANDVEIVNYINQTGLFKPVNASDIWYHARLQMYEHDSHLIFVNTKEQKTCKQLKEIIRTLEKSPIVTYANITLGHEEYGMPNFTNIVSWSQYFYVKVKDENDLSDLFAVIQETKTQFIKQDTFMPKWFMLSADKKSMGNALRMSQYFYETGKFVATTPDFIGSTVNR